MSADIAVNTSTSTTSTVTSESTNHQSPCRAIVVLGAGVIGLTIAYLLSDDPQNYKVTVVARELPSEHHLSSQGWSSPWAGANWSPVGGLDERQLRWERYTFEKLWSMTPSGLTMELPSRILYPSVEGANAEPRWKDIVRDFRVIPESELSGGFKAGLGFTTVSLNAPVYLNWLRDELEKRDNITFVHKHVASIEEAAFLGGSDCVIVNATGLGARSLLGVEDELVHPIRGQTIVVHAPHVKEFLSAKIRNENNEATYIIPRPGGTCILGGTFQVDNYNFAVDQSTARRIYERCTTVEPGLQLSRGAKILSHNVGLRPGRRGGARVELESIDLPLKSDLVPYYGDGSRPERSVKVIHAYGLGPAGYQASWGVAKEVVELLSKA